MKEMRGETEVDRTEAIALGRRWADERADALRDALPAADWPDFWDDAKDGPLPIGIRGARRRVFVATARRAARDRWRELLAEQRTLEGIEEDPHEAEASAVRLEAELREMLPEGTSSGRDGSRVYVLDSATGMERTVTSLEAAWHIIDEWGEKRRGGI